MFPRNYKKQNKLIKYILKIFNLYAYEKETLNTVNPSYKNDGKNFTKLNNKSFNFSKGYLSLTRKINKIDIFFRFSPNNNMWNSTKSWKRIVPNTDKKTLISVCLLSLKESILHFLKKHESEINIHLIADNSDSFFDNRIKKLLKSDKFKTFYQTSEIKGNRGSFVECCNHADNADDIIFFIEDDYLFEINCIEEMLITYSRISSLLKEDIILCPSDYPFYYDSLYNTNIVIGKNHRWRTVNETLLTFMLSKKIYTKYRNKIRSIGEKENNPFERPLHEIYLDTCCLAPIKTLSYHLGRDYPSINENHLHLWNKYYPEYKILLTSNDC